MKKAIVGKKIGMTQIFTEDGRLVPVTVIEAGPCTVVQTKTVETDGYTAVQVGFGEMTEKRAEKLHTKAELGHYKKAGVEAKRVLREFRFDDCSSYKVGDVITVEQFAAGDKIDVTGTSKGHGIHYDPSRRPGLPDIVGRYMFGISKPKFANTGRLVHLVFLPAGKQTSFFYLFSLAGNKTEGILQELQCMGTQHLGIPIT